MASLAPDEKAIHQLVDELLDVCHDSRQLDLRFQKLVVEVVMIRLAYGLESFHARVSHKLLCNATYCDARRSAPRFQASLVPFRSAIAAEAAIAKNNKRYVKWTTLKDVENNLKPFLDPSDHFLVERKNLDGTFEDIRKVRNHIAHRTKSTNKDFRAVLAKVYTSPPRGFTPAKLLLSKRKAFLGAGQPNQATVIEQYLRWVRLASSKLVGR